MLAALWDFYFPTDTVDVYFLSAECLNSTETLLDVSLEIWEAESSAASTLLTLLAALLVFVPFGTARISSLIVFATSAALLTCSLQRPILSRYRETKYSKW